MHVHPPVAEVARGGSAAHGSHSHLRDPDDAVRDINHRNP